MNPSDHNDTTHDPSGPDPSDSEYSEEWLSAYIDDELSVAQRTIVEQRIAGDSAAQQLLRELQHMRGLIGQLPAWSGGQIHHQPATDSSMHSESFTETLEQACRSHDEASRANLESLPSRLELAAEPSRQDVKWWRPIALAVCLALLTGGGIWWWQADSSSSLATSARITESADRPTDNIAPLALPLETAPAELEDAAARNPAGQSESRMADALRGGSGDAANAASSRAATGTEAMSEGASNSLEGGMGGGLGRAMSNARSGDTPQRMMRGAPNTAPREASSARSADSSSDGMLQSSTESTVADSTPATRQRLSPPADESSPSSRAVDQRGSAAEVQVAHSAGWSAAEVTRGLQRLAPLLNIPQVASSSPVAGGQQPTESASDIPVGLIAQRPAAKQTTSTKQTTPLMELLSQQPVTLQPLSPSQTVNFSQYLPLPHMTVPQITASRGAVAEDSDASGAATESLATRAPADESRADERPADESRADESRATVALFVLREEADQILQAVRQSGEMLANPVWITSASGSTTPARPKQQVVLLFTPQ